VIVAAPIEILLVLNTLAFQNSSCFRSTWQILCTYGRFGNGCGGMYFYENILLPDFIGANSSFLVPVIATLIAIASLVRVVSRSKMVRECGLL